MDKIQKYKTREYKAKGRFFLDNQFVDQQLASMPSVAAKVYLVLCRMVDKDQHCYPGTALLAKKTGLSRQGVFNAAKELEDRRLILVDRAKKTSKENEVNHYHLIDRSVWEKGRVVKTVDHPTVVQKLDHLIQKVDHKVIKPVDSKDTQSIKDTQLRETSISPYEEKDNKKNKGIQKQALIVADPAAEADQPQNEAGEADQPLSPAYASKKYTSLTDLTEADFQEIADQYKGARVTVPFVLNSYDDLINYCESSGKKYKNYKAALRNFVKSNALKIGKEEYDRHRSSKVAVFDPDSGRKSNRIVDLDDL